MFMLICSLVATISAYVLGSLSKEYGYHPTNTPHDYGRLVTIFTVGPCLLSVPFFLISGIQMRNIKRTQIALGQLDRKELDKQVMVMKQMTMIGDDIVDFNNAIEKHYDQEIYNTNMPRAKSLNVDISNLLDFSLMKLAT